MQNYIEKNTCEICDENGSEVSKINYTDPKIKDFFMKFYGPIGTELLYKFIQNIQYTLILCENCQYLWQKNQPTDQLAFNLYEKIIDKNQSFNKSQFSKKNNEIRFNSEFEFVYNFFDKKKINLLDFGAGWGTWFNSIDKNKANLYAFEVSPSRKEYLEKLENVKVIDESEIKDYKNFFDFIRLEQVLEHVTDLKTIMNSLKKIAKKGGLINVSVPDGAEIFKKKNYFVIEKGPTQPLEHVNCFTNKSLTKLFIKNNFIKLTKQELILNHLKNTPLNKDKIKYLISDFKKNLYSTSIKFINKMN